MDGGSCAITEQGRKLPIRHQICFELYLYLGWKVALEVLQFYQEILVPGVLCGQDEIESRIHVVIYHVC